ncbi:right-handed parallel beta-helix repeat-containing protein [Salinigranum halophilum]|uniref:right-handed parallel beta-helix repeat-containing protein n=1 Tax=Salinigranum halophilum TaxID=2565931 RepID=UPI0010A8D679|nr:right-handed parallel beta-helix repeat-containing protein [Salinigranum halophilum]
MTRSRLPSSRPSRRRFLAAVGSTAVAGLLAGCGGQRGSQQAQSTPAATTESTPTATATPTPTGLAGTYFVDPVNGDDEFAGNSPETAFASLQPLTTNGRVALRPGDVIKLRATAPIVIEDNVDFYLVKGTRENPIVIEPYGDGRPVIDASEVGGSAIRMEGAQYMTLRGFELENAGNDGIQVPGAANGNQQAMGCVFEDLEIHHYGQGESTEGNGIGFYRDSYDHVVRDVVCHHGSVDDNSDGFYIGGQNRRFSGGHRFVRCVAYRNADDGFDFFRCDPERPSTLVDCVAFGNGRDGEGATGDGNGFKMGGGWRTGGNHVVRARAFDNDAIGFDCNGASAANTFDNCTAYGNGTYGFEFTGDTDPDHVVRNCIAFENSEGPANLLYNARSEANTWDLEIDDPRFASVVPDDSRFLHLTAGSPCIDAGVDVGVSFVGAAPDLGAFEFES